MTPRERAPRIHPTAIIEDGVRIGDGTAIWDHVHVRGPAEIGRDCIIGEKTYIAYGVVVGDYVKINAMVYVPTGITIENRVMIAAGVIFTNDRYPRAFAEEADGLAESGPTEDTVSGRVCEGATIGAGALMGPGVTVGAYAMVGMGAVVTADVPPHALVVGNPARVRGWVCTCGRRLPGESLDALLRCGRCGRRFGWSGDGDRRMVHCRD